MKSFKGILEQLESDISLVIDGYYSDLAPEIVDDLVDNLIDKLESMKPVLRSDHSLGYNQAIADIIKELRDASN